jgi:tetratricopeptide (TPR) repeat protein
MVLRLHERDAELAVLDAALGDAAAGRGGTVVVQGPAGIGKTSLLEAVREAAPDRGLAVAAARGSELETAYAWGVARQLLEPRLRGMTEAARERALDGAAALAAPVLLPERAGAAAHADPVFGALHGLYWLVANLAASRPQLLVVDDLQWADAASARFVAFLANRVDAVPVLLLAARRPDPGPPPAPAALLEPRPLTLDGTAAVLAERDGAGARGLAAACHAATGGNPLLVRRLAVALGEDGGADAAALVARVGPDALAGAVGAAITRLGEGPRRLAHAVAVLETAPLVTAARLAGQDEADAAAHAGRLAAAGILRDSRPLEFAHALVRDAVLAALSAGDRARLHGDAARLLRAAGADDEAVAVHLLRTEPAGDPTTAATLAAAGRRALASGATREAAALLQRALAEPPDGERPALLLDLARAQHGAGGAVLDHIREAFALAGDDATRAEAVLCLQWAGGPGQMEPAETIAMLETALAGVAGRDHELELRLESLRMTVAFMDPELMVQIVGSAERFAGLPGRTQGECELLLHAALHRFIGGRPAHEVGELLERAVASPPVLAATGPDSFHVPFVAGQLYKADRLGKARELVEWQLAESARRGSAPGFVLGSIDRAWIALREGDAVAAEADARAAYELVTEVAWHRHFAAAALVDVLVDRGGLDEAHTVIDAAMSERGATQTVGGELLLSTRSHLREASGDAQGALEDQLAARATYGPFVEPDPNFPGWLRLARMRHATGDAETARRDSDAALAYAHTWGTPGYIGQALTVAGLLRGGDEGLALLREAVAELERSPARRELAVSLVELGAALRRRGERVAAREPLRRALDIATRAGSRRSPAGPGKSCGSAGRACGGPRSAGWTPSRRASGGSPTSRRGG